MTDEEKRAALEPGGSYWRSKGMTKERDAEIHRDLESAQWLRFAEAAIPMCGGIATFPEVSTLQVKACADFADAMVKEAKERGRL